MGVGFVHGGGGQSPLSPSGKVRIFGVLAVFQTVCEIAILGLFNPSPPKGFWHFTFLSNTPPPSGPGRPALPPGSWDALPAALRWAEGFVAAVQNRCDHCHQSFVWMNLLGRLLEAGGPLDPGPGGGGAKRWFAVVSPMGRVVDGASASQTPTTFNSLFCCFLAPFVMLRKASMDVVK